MYPMYKWMDSYTPNENPRFEAKPSHHMKMNPMAPSLSYQPWPYGGNYGYPVPPESHGCCSHGHTLGPYSFQPPYPHYTPPFHFHGGYPPFPGVYPPVAVPPPNYRFEQPIYEYDKDAPRHHQCCSCRHHLSKCDNEKVGLEEPKVEKKRDDSWASPELRSSPYPIMWIPRGYTNNTESEVKEKEKSLHDHGHDERSKLFDTKSLEPSKQGENDKGVRYGDGTNLPFPFFLLPYANNEVLKEPKESNMNQQSQSFGINDKKIENSAGEDDSKIIKKVIPVKPMETREDKRSTEGGEMKAVDTKDHIEEKSSGNTGRKQSSPPKTSKLPPVCLRIDPPKKKNGNGGSRSPSPPKNKEEPKNLATEGVKKSKEEEFTKRNIKSVKVINGVTDEDKTGNVILDLEDKDCREEVNGHEKAQMGNDGFGIGETEGIDHAKKVERKKLTEHEAAMMIQSAYRGFEVRKSQPLMKLKLIAEVRKQVAEVRNRVQDLESSSVRIDDKQKMVIGETIMSHLLKLDTIQGLHPVVRDVRKSVAKELVYLQEKLDSLMFSKSEAPSEPSGAESLDVMNPKDDVVQDTFDQTQVIATVNSEDVKPDSSMEEAKFDLEAIDPSKPSSPMETGLCSKDEVKSTEGQDDGVVQAHDLPTLEPHLESKSQSQQCDEESADGQFRGSVETEQCVELPSLDVQEEKISMAGEEIDDLHGQSATKFDQTQVIATVNSEDVKPDSSMEEAKFDLEAIDPSKPSSPMETGLCSKDEVKSTEGQDDGVVQAHDLTTLEPHLESKSQSQQCDEESADGQLRGSVETEQCVELPSLDVPEEKISMAGEELDNLHGQSVTIDTCVSAKVNDDIEGDLAQMVASLEDNGGKEGGEQEPEKPQEALVEPLKTEDDVHVEQEQLCEVESQKHNEDDGLMAESKIEEAKDEVVEVPEVLPIDDSHDREGVEKEEGEVKGQRQGVAEEENKRLKEAMEKLIKSGNQQLAAISKLSERVTDLEKKLSRKKKLKMRKCKHHGHGHGVY